MQVKFFASLPATKKRKSKVKDLKSDAPIKRVDFIRLILRGIILFFLIAIPVLLIRRALTSDSSQCKVAPACRDCNKKPTCIKNQLKEYETGIQDSSGKG